MNSQRPPLRSIRSILVWLVERGMTAMNSRPSSRANHASLTAVEPLDASMIGVSGPTHPLHRA